MLGRRKRNLSGKWWVIDGNHPLTCETMLNAFKAVEEVTKQR